jgi:hypothetical protein
MKTAYKLFVITTIGIIGLFQMVVEIIKLRLK